MKALFLTLGHRILFSLCCVCLILHVATIIAVVVVAIGIGSVFVSSFSASHKAVVKIACKTSNVAQGDLNQTLFYAVHTVCVHLMRY